MQLSGHYSKKISFLRVCHAPRWLFVSPPRFFSRYTTSLRRRARLFSDILLCRVAQIVRSAQSPACLPWQLPKPQIWRTIYNPRMLHFLIRLLNYYWFLLRCSMWLSLFAAKLHSVWRHLSTESFRAAPRGEGSLTGRQQKLGVIKACRSCPRPTLLMFPPNCLVYYQRFIVCQS